MEVRTPNDITLGLSNECVGVWERGTQWREQKYTRISFGNPEGNDNSADLITNGTI